MIKQNAVAYFKVVRPINNGRLRLQQKASQKKETDECKFHFLGIFSDLWAVQSISILI